VFGHTQARYAFSAGVAIFIQHAPLADIDVTKHPRHVQTWRVSLSIGMSHVTIHSAIQVYRLTSFGFKGLNDDVRLDDRVMTQTYCLHIFKRTIRYWSARENTGAVIELMIIKGFR
jgi:hypothetical protein